MLLWKISFDTKDLISSGRSHGGRVAPQSAISGFSISLLLTHAAPQSLSSNPSRQFNGHQTEFMSSSRVPAVLSDELAC